MLDRRHVYILPTRAGLAFGLALVAMLTGSVNYNLSLGFALTFLLAGLCIIAMLHTWRNLVRLSVAAGRSSPVFTGETAQFTLLAADHERRERLSVGARIGKLPAAFADVPAGGCGTLELTLATQRRGWMSPGRCTLFTDFPLGLFHAWSYVETDARCLVYPRPAPPGLVLPQPEAGERATGRQPAGGDADFSGLRSYQEGDSPRRVDWKTSARAFDLLTKQFQGEAPASLWLDWNLAPGRDMEGRIAQLARWVLDADAAGSSYGLRLPDEEIAPGRGEAHYHRCLRALALWKS